MSQVPKTDLKVEWVVNLAPWLQYYMAIARAEIENDTISECANTGSDVSWIRWTLELRDVCRDFQFRKRLVTHMTERSEM